MSSNRAAALKVEMRQHLVVPRPHVHGRPDTPTPRLAWSELAGRLVELSGAGNTAALSLAFSLVLDAQREGETVVWLGRGESSFYPPDAAAGGIDLTALAVVRCPEARSVARTADRLARSGAFGLVVLDLGDGDVPMPLQSRLAGLAQTHDAAIVLLTEKNADAPSVGSLVSLRGQAERHGAEGGRFVCRFRAIKDKRRGPGRTVETVHHGPAGLC
jgi:recombination protein RecA